MASKWNAKTGKFEPVGNGKGNKRTEERAIISASRKGNAKTFSVPVTLVMVKSGSRKGQRRPNVTPAILASWAEENGLTVKSAQYSDDGSTLDVTLA